MRNPAFCICKNKGADQLCGNPADQLCGNRAADQRLCFRNIDSTIPLLLKSKIFCGCTAQSGLDLVGNSEDRFPHDTAQLVLKCFRNWRDSDIEAVKTNDLISLRFAHTVGKKQVSS